MDEEYYTAETYYNEQMAEFTAEQEWEKMQEKLAPFDPYEYEDGDESYIDYYAEASLFGEE
jgi:hypothetical protein